MGCLVKSSLSALSSVQGTVCPTDLTLDQYTQTFNGDFKFNFISALSGIQDFKKLNFTNFYLTTDFLLDEVTSFKEIKIKPESFFTTLNFSTSSDNYLIFEAASLSSFKTEDNIIQAEFYGTTSFTKILSEGTKKWPNIEKKNFPDFSHRTLNIYDYRKFYYYFSYCEGGFLSKNISTYQITLKKNS